MFVHDRTLGRVTNFALRFRNDMRIVPQTIVFHDFVKAEGRRVLFAAQVFIAAIWHAITGVQLTDTFKAFHRSKPLAGLRLPLRLSYGVGLCIGVIFAAASDPVWAASGRVRIESDGVSRSAILVEHARLKKSRRPVIIILHGGGGNAKRVRHLLGLEEKARSASPVMIYPDAIGGQWNDVGTPGVSADTTFIHDLIAKLIKEGIADRRRIFIIGGSSGGLLAMKAACSGVDEFAGVIAYSASLPADLAASCKPVHPTPFLLILGTADPLIPYNGGPANLIDSKAELLSGKATFDLFGKLASCGAAHTTTAYADHDTRDKSRAFLDKLTGCKVPVELLRVEGGGHLLPRIGALSPAARAPEGERSAPSGMRNRDVDAPLLMWDFLRHLGA